MRAKLSKEARKKHLKIIDKIITDDSSSTNYHIYYSIFHLYELGMVDRTCGYGWVLNEAVLKDNEISPKF